MLFGDLWLGVKMHLRAEEHMTTVKDLYKK